MDLVHVLKNSTYKTTDETERLPDDGDDVGWYVLQS